MDAKEKERLEAAGHQAALLYIENLAQTKAPLGHLELRELHRRIFEHSWPGIAGRYRTHEVQIANVSYLPPHWSQVQPLLKQALDSLNYRIKLLPPHDIKEIIRLAAQAHYDIVSIHPFQDGNGRVARLVMNYVFLFFDLPYLIISKEAREEYLDTLALANQGDLQPFVDFIARQYRRSLDMALGLLEEEE